MDTTWILQHVTFTPSQQGDRQGRSKEFAEAYARTSLAAANLKEVDSLECEGCSINPATLDALKVKRATVTPTWWAFWVLFRYRTLRSFKDPDFLGPRIADKIIFSIVIFSAYWHVGNTTDPSQYINIAAVLFMWTTVRRYTSGLLASLVLQCATASSTHYDMNNARSSHSTHSSLPLALPPTPPPWYSSALSTTGRETTASTARSPTCASRCLGSCWSPFRCLPSCPPMSGLPCSCRAFGWSTGWHTYARSCSASVRVSVVLLSGDMYMVLCILNKHHPVLAYFVASLSPNMDVANAAYACFLVRYPSHPLPGCRATWSPCCFSPAFSSRLMPFLAGGSGA